MNSCFSGCVPPSLYMRASPAIRPSGARALLVPVMLGFFPFLFLNVVATGIVAYKAWYVNFKFASNTGTSLTSAIQDLPIGSTSISESNWDQAHPFKDSYWPRFSVAYREWGGLYHFLGELIRRRQLTSTHTFVGYLSCHFLGLLFQSRGGAGRW